MVGFQMGWEPFAFVGGNCNRLNEPAQTAFGASVPPVIPSALETRLPPFRKLIRKQKKIGAV
jgi:hypothetical protein